MTEAEKRQALELAGNAVEYTVLWNSAADARTVMHFKSKADDACAALRKIIEEAD